MSARLDINGVDVVVCTEASSMSLYSSLWPSMKNTSFWSSKNNIPTSEKFSGPKDGFPRPKFDTLTVYVGDVTIDFRESDISELGCNSDDGDIDMKGYVIYQQDRMDHRITLELDVWYPDTLSFGNVTRVMVTQKN